MDIPGQHAPLAQPGQAAAPVDAGIKEGVAAYGAKTFTTMVRMDDGRMLKVTIKYPKNSKVTPEKAAADLDRLGGRMAKLASGLALGTGGLETIRIKRGQVHGVWTNSKGKRVSGNLSKKLEKDYKALDPQDPKRDTLQMQLQTINKTMSKFTDIYASISSKD